jgi:hypothetical protein
MVCYPVDDKSFPQPAFSARVRFAVASSINAEVMHAVNTRVLQAAVLAVEPHLALGAVGVDRFVPVGEAGRAVAGSLLAESGALRANASIHVARHCLAVRAEKPR